MHKKFCLSVNILDPCNPSKSPSEGVAGCQTLVFSGFILCGLSYPDAPFCWQMAACPAGSLMCRTQEMAMKRLLGMTERLNIIQEEGVSALVTGSQLSCRPCYFFFLKH